MRKKWKIGVAAVCMFFLVTVAYAASAGSQGDPLVTLSYLDNVFTPKVNTMVTQAVTDQQAKLKTDLDKAIQDWDAKIKTAIGSGSGEGGSSVFAVVELSQGQTLVGDVGCEVMLRVGSATCGADGATGLIDVTSGGTLANGKALETNHLYMVTISTRSVTATSGTVKVLARGPYTISG